MNRPKNDKLAVSSSDLRLLLLLYHQFSPTANVPSSLVWLSFCEGDGLLVLQRRLGEQRRGRGGGRARWDGGS